MSDIIDIPETSAPPKPKSPGKTRRERRERAEAKAAAKAVEKPKPHKKKKKKRKAVSAPRGDATLAVNLLLSAGILVFLVLGGLLVYRHNAFCEMKRVVEAQTFYDGTTVEGIDLSGKTLNAARNHWASKIEPKYASRVVNIDGAGPVTAVDLGYQSDFEAILYSAWSAGRRGSLEERYRSAVSGRYAPLAWQVHRSLWTEATMDGYVSAMAAQIDQPAVDAEIQSFDVENYAFVLTESQTGRKLDEAKLKADIAQALQAGGGSVTPVIDTLQPKVTQADVNSRYGMIASAVTNASSSKSNRIKNIQLAVSLINGKRVRDGETFSFNDTVGERTTARGFKKATAYSGGDVTEEVGGGICQVSTTLFNAAVKSDMEIVERHNHSLTVSYVDKGKDAAVNWSSQDLKFTNHSGDDVYISCFVSEDKRIHFAIFGRLLPDGETITLEGRTTETIKYDTEYQQNAFLAPGETKVISEGKNGYKAEAYKMRWDAAGNRISKELLCKSVYKARNEVIQFGR